MVSKPAAKNFSFFLLSRSGIMTSRAERLGVPWDFNSWPQVVTVRAITCTTFTVFTKWDRLLKSRKLQKAEVFRKGKTDGSVIYGLTKIKHFRNCEILNGESTVRSWLRKFERCVKVGATITLLRKNGVILSHPILAIKVFSHQRSAKRKSDRRKFRRKV